MSLLAPPGNPDLALLSLLAGILLVYVECNLPGLAVPGCIGTLLILLAGYSLHQLPLSSEAVFLSCAGASSLLAGFLVRIRRLAALAGVVALACGLRHLTEPFASRHVHSVTTIFATVAFASSTLWLCGVARQARENKRAPRATVSLTPYRIDLEQMRF